MCDDRITWWRGKVTVLNCGSLVNVFDDASIKMIAEWVGGSYEMRLIFEFASSDRKEDSIHYYVNLLKNEDVLDVFIVDEFDKEEKYFKDVILKNISIKIGETDSCKKGYSVILVSLILFHQASE